mgnify:CR=1 FL=1|jgi:hypothetical protein
MSQATSKQERSSGQPLLISQTENNTVYSRFVLSNHALTVRYFQ